MKRLWIVVTPALLAACAGMGGSKGTSEAAVPDADLGRLSQGQMGPVDEARQFLGSARDEQARAKLHVQEVQHEDQLAKADAQSAKADADRAAVQAKVANDSREPGQLEQARVMKQQSDARKRAADARADKAKFDARVSDAQKSFDQALQKARGQESQAMAAQQAWNDAQRQAQAQAVPTGTPATPTGTGMQTGTGSSAPSDTAKPPGQ